MMSQSQFRARITFLLLQSEWPDTSLFLYLLQIIVEGRMHFSMGNKALMKSSHISISLYLRKLWEQISAIYISDDPQFANGSNFHVGFTVHSGCGVVMTRIHIFAVCTYGIHKLGVLAPCVIAFSTLESFLCSCSGLFFSFFIPFTHPGSLGSNIQPLLGLFCGSSLHTPPRTP